MGAVGTTANTQGSLTRVNYATFAAVDHLLIAATPTLSAALSAAARTTSAPSSVTRLQGAYEAAEYEVEEERRWSRRRQCRAPSCSVSHANFIALLTWLMTRDVVLCVYERGSAGEYGERGVVCVCVCVCRGATTISGNNGVQQFSAFQAEQLS